ncbi:MAG TPA: hypothetical protein PLV25_06380, partial [Opitutales bacterium]|nr:hypothetical protein [Opitutales bacterium]
RLLSPKVTEIDTLRKNLKTKKICNQTQKSTTGLTSPKKHRARPSAEASFWMWVQKKEPTMQANPVQTPPREPKSTKTSAPHRTPKHPQGPPQPLADRGKRKHTSSLNSQSIRPVVPEQPEASRSPRYKAPTPKGRRRKHRSALMPSAKPHETNNGALIATGSKAILDSTEGVTLTSAIPMHTATHHPYLNQHLPIEWSNLTPEAARLDIVCAIEASSAA